MPQFPAVQSHWFWCVHDSKQTHEHSKGGEVIKRQTKAEGVKLNSVSFHSKHSHGHMNSPLVTASLNARVASPN